ncbi:MAG: winged helix-turn-helix domain-containing protein [Anaerolineae bacterium]|nr:winged helix-turn-helix domain-containing protein [Anaerolineae bacterium]
MALDRTAYISRADELATILRCVSDAESCAVVGLSNMGKSVLLRSVQTVAETGYGGVRAGDLAFIYIDFNLMVEMTEQGFYELILRSALATLSEQPAHAELCDRLQQAYDKVIRSSNAFLIPLGFNEGIVLLCENLGRQVVFLFDEFDGPFREIDPRVFLNLRALKDRYPDHLCYVVATGRPMASMRGESEIGEFCELFAHQTLYLGPLSYNDVQHAVTAFMGEEHLPVTARDVDFVWTQTGGHPGMLNAVCHALASVGGVEDPDGYRMARDKLDSDANVRSECVKLWNGLRHEHQAALLQYAAGDGVDRQQLAMLQRMGLLSGDRELAVTGALFAGFVRRQRLVKTPYVPGVRVDVDSGEVWVDGARAETLTDLEYRALLLFYGRIGEICDKYQIVEAVWGDDYIDEVDDARIEKLISRLRKKLEVIPDSARYLETVRGRGYRLVRA